ncbi:Myosin tail family protein [Trichomonas vaginalis G3]|uniref:Myosin tail family protein n=1 Tax=Trichomonas vaginalis (strain ATCC PRA-98 / G3) TaxID=412133 RepID=A2F5L5_TRIV3|nr:motor protein [Trichomonas vaginalis G3]EAX99778.1 Myosin tail family protein [Trichomonas vaginalis G3]KAI5494413.1 motor protein [Trichomonas vaginalis G3]|eukprot:XP_001312708.1 Myosin tail family protein [Trichomonas vaginalis G3]
MTSAKPEMATPSPKKVDRRTSMQELTQEEIRKKQAADQIFNGKKHRRESSASKIFIGDHLGLLHEESSINTILNTFDPPEELFFADHCTRLTNRNHMEDCGFIITTNHICITNTRLNAYIIPEPVEIKNIEFISTSLETDNAVVIHLPDYNSELVMSSNKIELMKVLMERYRSIAAKDLEIKFNNVIEFDVDNDTIFEFNFVRASDGVRMTLFIKAKPGAPAIPPPSH